jgi:putative solute:sodium symporter small subunit
MSKERHETELATAALNAWQGFRVTRLKNLILTLLGVWIVYFAAVNMFARTLNKIDVPLLGLPLGVYLVIQGAMIVFLVTLYLFTKNRALIVANV